MSQFIAHQRARDGKVQTVETHLQETAEYAALFASKLSLEDLGTLIGLAHDLGKYSKEFQDYLASAVGLLDPDQDEDYVDAKSLKGKVDHSTAGAQLLWREVRKRGTLGEIVGQILALCVASHHSGLIDCLSAAAVTYAADRFTARMDKDDSRVHLAEVLEKADKTILDRIRDVTAKSELLQTIQGACKEVMEADEVPGLDPQENSITQFKLGLMIRFLFSCLVDGDRISTADFENPKAARQRHYGAYPEWAILVERLERHLHKLPACGRIDDIRRDVSAQCKQKGRAGTRGIYSLTVPTGGGKTLASLRFALHHADERKLDRVIYAIPFTTIIDQNAEEVRKILEPEDEGAEFGSVLLEHHSNLLPERQTWKSKILAENWDAPLIFTTNVQILETLFGAGTRGARRMHQLARTVIIFDEIQAIPTKCIHLFCNAVNFLVDHCSSTVVLCTATQPMLNAVDPVKGALKIPSENEIVENVGELFGQLKRVDVANRRKQGGWTHKEIADLARAETNELGNCLTIVNTKRSAREVFDQMRSDHDMLVRHLSTSMCAAHRRDVLAEVKDALAAGDRVMCVSTQLIEAGVNIDFASVVRFVAGLDSIAQAAGRCNRNDRLTLNGEKIQGRVHVVNSADERIDLLKDILAGRINADRVLDEYVRDPGRFKGNILGPEAISAYFRYYYHERRGDMEYPLAPGLVGSEDSLLNLLSINRNAVNEFKRAHGRDVDLFFRQSFMTAAKAFKAIDAPTQGVVVPYGTAGNELINDLCAAFDLTREFERLKAAQQFTVNLFPPDFEYLCNERALREVQRGTGIFYLDKRYYSHDLGVSRTPIDRMETLYA